VLVQSGIESSHQWFANSSYPLLEDSSLERLKTLKQRQWRRLQRSESPATWCSLIDFSQKLCAAFSQIWRSADGASRSNSDTELLVKNFLAGLDGLSAALRKYHAYLETGVIRAVANKDDSADRNEIRAVIEGCRRAAATLVARLETLKTGKTAGKWTSLATAVKVVWKEKELREMEAELQKFSGTT